MESNILITGAQGQLGRSLQQLAPAHWKVAALGSRQLDITDAAAVEQQVKALRPQLVINAAAYNAVDRAEQERERAFAVNAQGPLNLARAANEAGARLVHVSTDYVFDGRANRPYDEQAVPNPLNAYGVSKLEGERWVLREQPGALVVRTAWVYSAAGQNFVAAMLRAAGPGRPLYVVDDQTGAPTFAGDLARAIIELVAHSDAQGGLYHYSGATALTRYEYVRAIFEAADRIEAGEPADSAARMESAGHGARLRLLHPIASRDYPSAAVRPMYSVLDCGKMAALGIAPRPLEESLPGVVRALLA